MAENYRKALGTANGLRYGYTTGTTATAAAKAAALCLITGEQPESITISLPESRKAFSGMEIEIPVHSCRLLENREFSGGLTAKASVLKDSGDEKDDTNGIEIFVAACFTAEPGIGIAGGEGIGTVTGDGLPINPGNPAINPIPKKMIETEVGKLLSEAETAGSLPDGVRGMRVEISAPDGLAIAEKTWNSRIGVGGGISIIGTSGVVEPRSEKAFRASLGLVIKTAAQKRDTFSVISGYVGEHFLSGIGADENGRIAVGDLVGFALTQCQRRGFKRLFLPLHIGKLTKIAAGLFNTHSDYGDARLETLAAAAGVCGATQQQIGQLLDMSLAEEAIALLLEWKLEDTFSIVAGRAKWRCEKYIQKAAAERPGSSIPGIETAALDLKGNLLGWSGGYETAEELCGNFM